MNFEYGWVKYTTTKKKKDGKTVFHTQLTDHPDCAADADTDKASFVLAFQQLLDKLKLGS